MKNSTLEKQINWFMPHQEEDFIKIYNDTKKNKAVTCSLHYFIPLKEINIKNTDDLERIIKPKKNIDNITINETSVSTSDIYIQFDVTGYIDKENNIGKVLKMASKYIKQLDKECNKKRKEKFPKGKTKKITNDLISIIENKGILKFPALVINVNIEYDFSLSVIINKSINSIKEKQKDFDGSFITLEKYAKENGLNRIDADDIELLGTDEKYLTIYSIGNFDETGEYRNVDDIKILIKEIKKLLKII